MRSLLPNPALQRPSAFLKVAGVTYFLNILPEAFSIHTSVFHTAVSCFMNFILFLLNLCYVK